jgi:hypothetical protein
MRREKKKWENKEKESAYTEIARNEVITEQEYSLVDV